MKKKFLMFAALIAVISLAFVFTGCGGGTDDDEDDPFRFYTRREVTFVPNTGNYLNLGRMFDFSGSEGNDPPRTISGVTHIALTFSSEPTLYFHLWAEYNRPGFATPVFWFQAPSPWDPRRTEEGGTIPHPDYTIWNAATNTLYINLNIWDGRYPEPVRTATDPPHTGSHLTHIRHAGFLVYVIGVGRPEGGSVTFSELGLTSAVLLTPP